MELLDAFLFVCTRSADTLCSERGSTDVVPRTVSVVLPPRVGGPESRTTRRPHPVRDKAGEIGKEWSCSPDSRPWCTCTMSYKSKGFTFIEVVI